MVKDAHLFALEKVKVGTPVGEIDRTAREYIKRKALANTLPTARDTVWV